MNMAPQASRTDRLETRRDNMLLIHCPWCGPRAETEFSYGGEAGITRPLDSDEITDRAWGDYVFMRENPRGTSYEQWLHTQGCRRWFKAIRDTVSYKFQSFETFGPAGDSNVRDQGKQK
jgi:sarcosine oxidase subunit delta